jgi:uncharacterized protein YdhG (YjbR/CyaY superfamily)
VLKIPTSVKQKGSEVTKEVLSIDQVTPELAAQIVKHYILPMFDNDSRKSLRRKYARLNAVTGKG